MTYEDDRSTGGFDRLLALAVMDALHKRLTYLERQEIVILTDYAKEVGVSPQGLLNTARRQTVPTFRERGRWKIGRPASSAGSFRSAA